MKLIAFVALTRLMSGEDYSYFVLTYTIVLFIGTSFTFGSTKALLKFVAADNSMNNRSHYFHVSLNTLTIFVVVSVFLFLFDANFFDYSFRKYLQESVSINLYQLLIWVIFFGLFDIISAYARAQSSVIFYYFTRELLPNASILISISIFWYTDTEDTGSFYANINLLNLMFLLISVAYLFRYMPVSLVYRGNKNTLKKSLNFGSYIMFGFFLWSVKEKSYLIFLKQHFDLIRLGEIFNILRIASILTLVNSALNTFIAPNISKLHSQENIKELSNLYQSTVRFGLVVIFPIFLIFYGNADIILYQLFGYEQNYAGAIFRAFCLSRLISAFCGMPSSLLQMTEFVKIESQATVIFCIIFVTASYYAFEILTLLEVVWFLAISFCLYDVCKTILAYYLLGITPLQKSDMLSLLCISLLYFVFKFFSFSDTRSYFMLIQLSFEYMACFGLTYYWFKTRIDI